MMGVPQLPQNLFPRDSLLPQLVQNLGATAGEGAAAAPDGADMPGGGPAMPDRPPMGGESTAVAALEPALLLVLGGLEGTAPTALPREE